MGLVKFQIFEEMFSVRFLLYVIDNEETILLHLLLRELSFYYWS